LDEHKDDKCTRKVKICGPEVTKYMVEVLADFMQKHWMTADQLPRGSTLGGGVDLAARAVFGPTIKNVQAAIDGLPISKPFGKLDFKDPKKVFQVQDSSGKTITLCPQHCPNTVTICEKWCIEHGAPGNISFGVTGGAASGLVTTLAASKADADRKGEPETPDDIAEIRLGYSLFSARRKPGSPAKSPKETRKDAIRDALCKGLEKLIGQGIVVEIDCILCPLRYKPPK
jgi:hypothetical protein